MEWLLALIALSAMEIVLGIDNLVVLAIVTGKLPEEQRPRARKWGLLLALVMRVALLCGISFIIQMKEPIFYLTDVGFPEAWFETTQAHAETAAETVAIDPRLHPANIVSWRDVILLLGGLFLIRNSVVEIHEKIERDESEGKVAPVATFSRALIQIALLDMIFSLDSVITAVGMTEDLTVMIIAVTIAIGMMMLFANPISDFVSRHPTLTMLALSFLILIGVMLVAEAVGTHVDKRYIYFAMAFSLFVELLNLRMKHVKAVPHVA